MGALQKYSEETLIELLRTHREEGFSYLYEHYSGALYGTIRKIIADEGTAEDVLQESFIKIWKGIEGYDASKGRLYTWMLRLCRNCAIDRLRSKGEVMKSKIQSREEPVYETDANTLFSTTSIDTIGMSKALEGLKPEYQQVIHMSYYAGFTLDEISKQFSIPLGTVKTRMRQALILLRRHFAA